MQPYRIGLTRCQLIEQTGIRTWERAERCPCSRRSWPVRRWSWRMPRSPPTWSSSALTENKDCKLITILIWSRFVFWVNVTFRVISACYLRWNRWDFLTGLGPVGSTFKEMLLVSSRPFYKETKSTGQLTTDNRMLRIVVHLRLILQIYHGPSSLEMNFLP